MPVMAPILILLINFKSVKKKHMRSTKHAYRSVRNQGLPIAVSQIVAVEAVAAEYRVVVSLDAGRRCVREIYSHASETTAHKVFVELVASVTIWLGLSPLRVVVKVVLLDNKVDNKVDNKGDNRGDRREDRRVDKKEETMVASHQ